MNSTIAHAIATVNTDSKRYVSGSYSSCMDVKEIRLARLDELLREHGNNKAALARTLHKAPAQVSQWFNRVRSITEESARDIEQRAKRPKGWMDTRADDEQRPATNALVLDEALRSLAPEARREALDFIRYKLERARATFLAEKVGRYMQSLESDDDEMPRHRGTST